MVRDAQDGAPASRVGVVDRDPRFVSRERVLQMLVGSPERIVCLTAPGGYGKTTVVAQWAERDPRPFVWVQVRPQAPDAHWLVTEMLSRLTTAGVLGDVPAVPPATDTVEWHLGVLPAVERAVASASAPFVLVIDDAGAMQGDLWGSLLASVADALAPGCRLVLTTREGVPAALTRAVTRGDVRTIDTSVLALDALEGAALARVSAVSLNDADLQGLLEATKGWPVAVYLSLLAAQSGRRPLMRSRSMTSSSELARYLRVEIVSRMAPDDAEFLARCSVLADLDEATCDAVAGRPGSSARLRHLAETNHLLVAEDGGRYRMHPLLASFLSQEMRVVDPPRWRECHQAASAATEAAGNLDAAVFHARAAGDDDALGDLVWRHTGSLIATGQIAVLQRWLAGVDSARAARQPGLALACAWVAMQRGDSELLASMQTAAEESAGADPAWAPALLLLAAVGTDSVAGLEQKTRQFAAITDHDDPFLTVAHFLLGVALSLQEQRTEAAAELERALRLARGRGFAAMSARCLSAMAHLALLEGDRTECLARVRQTRVILGQHALDQLATTAPVFAMSALGYELEGRRAEARAEALRALRLTSRSAMVPAWTLVFGRLTLARVFLALGDVDNAGLLVQEARERYRPSAHSPAADRAFAEVDALMSGAGAGDRPTEVLSTAELRILQFLPTHLSLPQIADELFVSRHTVKSQSAAIYRKLGVHTRDEAIRRAAELGLVEAAPRPR